MFPFGLLGGPIVLRILLENIVDMNLGQPKNGRKKEINQQMVPLPAENVWD
jgi:hypothetical protein